MPVIERRMIALRAIHAIQAVIEIISLGLWIYMPLLSSNCRTQRCGVMIVQLCFPFLQPSLIDITNSSN